MPPTPAHSFRLVLALDGPVRLHESGGLLLREAIESTDLLKYARRLWETPHSRLRFLLELPASKRWLEVSLTAEYTAGERVTLIEAEIAALPHRLTTRELEVLALVAAGHSNPAIAEALFISPRTVSTQVETILGKLGAISRTAAGVLAMQNGWLRMPMPTRPEMLGDLGIAELLRDREVPVRETQGSTSPTPRRPHAVRLGLAYPESGPALDDGAQSRQGALLAIDEINRRGGVRGRTIDAITVNADIYSADGIARAFSELRDHEVHGVLMSYVFDESAAFSAAAAIGVPVLHTMTSKRHIDITRSDPERYRNVFQCVPPESNYGPGLVRFLALLDASPDSTGERTVRFVETTADSGQIADPDTLSLLASRGWRTTGIDTLEADPGSVDRLAAAIVGDPPAVLVVSEFLPSVLASLLLRLHAAACPSVVYTIYAPSVPEFVAAMGEAAEGLMWATVSGTYSDPFGAQFRSAYAARYGETPGHSQAGLAYDIVHMIAAAWQISADPSDVPGTINALRNTRYRGVNGSYTFAAGLQTTVAYPEETNDPSLGNAQLIFQVQNGEHRCLGPSPYDDGIFRRTSA